MLLRVQSYTSSVVPASDVISPMMTTEHKQLIAIFWRQISILMGHHPIHGVWSISRLNIAMRSFHMAYAWIPWLIGWG